MVGEVAVKILNDWVGGGIGKMKMKDDWLLGKEMKCD